MEEKLNGAGITNLGGLLHAVTTPALLPPILAIKGFTMKKIVLWIILLSNSLQPSAYPPDKNTKMPKTCIYPAIPSLVSTKMVRENGK